MSPRPLVLDSSAWIEIFNDGPLSKACMKELKTSSRVLVPALVFFEVYRKLVTVGSEDRALSAIAVLSQYEAAPMTREVALTAADLSLETGLAMVDSVMLAHARQEGALLFTLDNDFAGLSDIRVLRK